jgi:pimeloyl-ACP methyl ester carboxylesterase
MTYVTTSIDVTTEVSEAAGFGEPLHTRATVILPDPESLGPRPVVCFGFPGGGYSRQYFTFDMPDSSGGGEAGWHAERGWVFVSVDHPGVGESTVPSEPERLTFSTVAAANAATVGQIRDALVGGTLAEHFPAVHDPVVVGIGQSMGGCFTIVQQGLHATYAGIGVLGFSARHTTIPFPALSAAADSPFALRDDGLPALTWAFHYDDVPRDIVAQDMRDYPTRAGNTPEWGSATIPPCATEMLDPGIVATEAAAITAPVFVGVGERDVCPDPRAEPEAYASSPDITVFVCPRMSHMHNFASTREQFWSRLHAWGEGVAQRLE